MKTQDKEKSLNPDQFLGKKKKHPVSCLTLNLQGKLTIKVVDRSHRFLVVTRATLYTLNPGTFTLR